MEFSYLREIFWELDLEHKSDQTVVETQIYLNFQRLIFAYFLFYLDA